MSDIKESSSQELSDSDYDDMNNDEDGHYEPSGDECQWRNVTTRHLSRGQQTAYVLVRPLELMDLMIHHKMLRLPVIPYAHEHRTNDKDMAYGMLIERWLQDWPIVDGSNMDTQMGYDDITSTGPEDKSDTGRHPYRVITDRIFHQESAACGDEENDTAMALVYDPLYHAVLLCHGWLPVAGSLYWTPDKACRNYWKRQDIEETQRLIKALRTGDVQEETGCYLGSVRSEHANKNGNTSLMFKDILFSRHHEERMAILYRHLDDPEVMKTGRFKGTIFSDSKGWRRQRKHAMSDRYELRYNYKPVDIFALLHSHHDSCWFHSEYISVWMRLLAFHAHKQSSRLEGDPSTTHPGYTSILDASKDALRFASGTRITILVVGLYEKLGSEGDELGLSLPLACDVGALVGDSYTSLSGAHSVKSSGTHMLIRMVADHRKSGVRFFDLGMVMEYKKKLLGAETIDRNTFHERHIPGLTRSLQRDTDT